MTRDADPLDLLEREMQQPGLRHLVGKVSRPNFWPIIEYGRGSYPTRCSRMLRWAMDPGELA